MKNLLLLLLLCTGAFQISAQNLPVRTVTIFKNGMAMLEKNGKVKVDNGKYTAKELPDALFGTWWATAASGDLQSVFTHRDSVMKFTPIRQHIDPLKRSKGKTVGLWLYRNAQSSERVEGSVEEYLEVERRQYPGETDQILFKTKSGQYLTLGVNQIERVEYPEKPETTILSKVAESSLELRFRGNRSEQDISLLYLTGGIGWTPVYRLDLTDKNKGKLALRAEIANNAENLGDAELRLAVGLPNFLYANERSTLFNFDSYIQQVRNAGGGGNNYQSVNYQVAFDPETYEERLVAVPVAPATGTQVEDFYFYSLRPGNFPQFSRYQLPILETDISPTHYYECILPKSGNDYNYYNQKRSATGEAVHRVNHFIEFMNTGKQPWTTGAVNILSQAPDGLQPVSQDMLPYTPPGGKSKVRIAETPEIKITHLEGVADRQASKKQYFNRSYDLIKVEGEGCAVNYKNETVTLKVRRTVEGTPVESDQAWKLSQEKASLNVNSTFEVEWTFELKPGEEKKWRYLYEVYVDL